jgi:hypothetical protein
MMGKKKSNRLDGKELWSAGFGSLTAGNDLDIVLGSVKNLPLKHWRRNLLFFNFRDEDFLEMTGGQFPAKLVKDKAHPVFSLKPRPGNAGFRVCPCSSKRPFNSRDYRYIVKGCRLLHTGYTMDRHSYLIENLRFNIPASIAGTLRFKGEVPEEGLKTGPPKLARNKKSLLKSIKN